jgi:hypothetical protein
MIKVLSPPRLAQKVISREMVAESRRLALKRERGRHRLSVHPAY